MNDRQSNPDLRRVLHDGWRHYRPLTGKGVLAMTDTSDLVERLREDVAQLKKMSAQASLAGPETGVRVKDVSALLTDLTEAATALEAKAKEIEALRERVKEMEGDTPKFQRDGDSYLICEGHHHVDEPCEFERYVLEARAETAERRVAELEDRLDTANQIDWEKSNRLIIAERELEAANEAHRAMAKQLADLGRERDEARAALKPFADRAFQFDGVNSEYFCSPSVQVKHMRAARAVIEQGE